MTRSRRKGAAEGERFRTVPLLTVSEPVKVFSPAGVVSTQFSPGYPAQVDDISYGPPAVTEELINGTTTVRYKAPATNAADTASPNWRATAFNDSAWTAVQFNGSGGLTVPYSAALNPAATFIFAAWVAKGRSYPSDTTTPLSLERVMHFLGRAV